MAEIDTTTPKTAPAAAPVKSFMTAGPTLHYSHANVHGLWGFTVVIFVMVCYFWNQIQIGGPLSINLLKMADPSLFRLGQIVVQPISIYEYPWHIIVLGSLMGILAVAPVLVSQLYSFRYSLPLILGILFIAQLYLFSLFVMVSCIAAACRPLRFRSRIVAVALCIAPQLVYWAIWGGYPTADPVRWGFSFSPWIYAWISGLAMAALVLGIGHFTRYKPGLIGLVSFLFLAVTFGIFQKHIGFSEMDYQRYVAGNNPEDVPEFREHTLSATLDQVIADESLRSQLEGRFYGKKGTLRQTLKAEIQDLLMADRWPEWFQRKMTDDLKYQGKRRSLKNGYDLFIERWPESKRMPIAMYFRALLAEFHADIRLVGEQEILRFYRDYPFSDNFLGWHELFSKFPESPEALEARWRIAMHEAGNGQFDKADGYCQVALKFIREQRDTIAKDKIQRSDSFFSAFQKPANTVMTLFKLRDLQSRFGELKIRISIENRGDTPEALSRLAEFVMLNPYEMDYAAKLDNLLQQMDAQDALRDNILLEKAMLTADASGQLKLLTELIDQYKERDAGIQAQYELALLKIQLWKNPKTPEETKKQLAAEACMILTEFINNYPDSPFAEQADSLLQTLPSS
jgi:outer membrane protein assembly factor BamD (BamD/ComL family)